MEVAVLCATISLIKLMPIMSANNLPPDPVAAIPAISSLSILLKISLSTIKIVSNGCPCDLT